MSLLESIFLGIIQGITEFLPVSSSGHLSIIQNIFHIDTGSSILFDSLLHIGTLAVVFFVFRKDIWQLILSFFGMIRDLFHNLAVKRRNRAVIAQTPYRRIVSTNYRKFVLLILVSTIPTGVIGVIGKKLIADASQSLMAVGIGLIVTAALLLISDRAVSLDKIPQDVTYREAVIVGIAQGFATLPGISRSGATITACLLLGLNRNFSVKYSFILSIPAILGAAVLEIKDIAGESITLSQTGIYLAGMAAAAAVGMLCIRAMLSALKMRRFKYFAFYCLAVAVFAIAGSFFFH